MRIWSRLVVACVVVAAPSLAHGGAYQERFLGWSNDGAYYAITQSGTDEIDIPALCVSRRGDAPKSWPKDIPAPDGDDEGCSARFDEIFEGQDPQALVEKARHFIVAPRDKPPHGEKVALKKVGDGSVVEVTVSAAKVLGKGYFFLRDKTTDLPNEVASHWRSDGLAVAVEAGWSRSEQEVGYGPPAYVVVIPLDGSAANAQRPKTPREQSRALNLEGMKLLKAGKLDDAQAKFVAATEADGTFAIALYNLASVTSLRHDSGTAVVAIQNVIDLAGTDPEAKRAIAKAKTDHDLDFIASQSPYVARLLGRPRTKGDDWCIAAETRAREIRPREFTAFAQEAAPLVDPKVKESAVNWDRRPDFSCHVGDGKSQLSIAMYVRVDKRDVRIAWEIFPDGLFDADAIPDEKQPSKTIRLQKLAHVASISKTIIGAK